MGNTELHRRQYDIKMYLEETADKGAYTPSSTGSGCDPVWGEGVGLKNHFKHHEKLISYMTIYRCTFVPYV